MTIESVAAELKERPWGLVVMVVGNLNANLDQPKGDQREEEIAAVLHFLLRWLPCCWYGRAWSKVRLGRWVQSQTNYILGKDHCLFRNMAVRYTHHNSYNYMVLGCLHSAPLRELAK